MGWIKRNLFFVVGIAVALGLLGAGGFYIYKGWVRNSEAADKLNEIYGTLRGLQGQTPSPGNDKIDNTKTAKEQHRHVRSWIDASEKYFKPIPAIPAENCTSEAFARELRRTVDTLQHEADSAGVTLPPKYDFSFSAQRPLVRFAPGSLELLAVQLGEVKAITETVFSARANTLDSIQRVRVSEDDIAGPAGDYIDNHAITNDLAVITPYVVTFRCFTPELARVISAFSLASNTFLIKAVNVQPAGASSGVSSDYNNASMPGLAPGQMPFAEPMAQMPPPVQPVQPVVGKGGLQTVLKEQLLRVTLEVGIVKLLPKR
ncbi:MAG: Amuc_1100 family pilus-like protein [Verrucomicrobiae bacterium]